MIIFPAIDIKEGNVVRLLQGNFDEVTEYSGDPVAMARAMKHAWIAGREAYLAGRMPAREYTSPAAPSSPRAGRFTDQ